MKILGLVAVLGTLFQFITIDILFIQRIGLQTYPLNTWFGVIGFLGIPLKKPQFPTKKFLLDRMIKLSILLALGSCKTRQQELFIASNQIPKTLAHPCYSELIQVFDEC